MTKIGEINGEGYGYEVFKDESGFFSVFRGSLFEDEEFDPGSVGSRSKSYSSLESLVSESPLGAVFTKVGETESPEEHIARLKRVFKL